MRYRLIVIFKVRVFRCQGVFNMIITHKSKKAWKYTYIANQKLLTAFAGLQLIYREANKVADGFAKWAHSMDG